MPIPVPTSIPPTRRTVLRGLGVGAVTVGGVSLLGACSSRDVQAAAATASPAAAFTITDQRGKKISFDGPVRRIVTAIIPSPSMLAAVDGSYTHIVGINESTLTANRQGIFGTIFPGRRRPPPSPAPTSCPTSRPSWASNRMWYSSGPTWVTRSSSRWRPPA
ncbi:hypothetical protein NKH18_04995 [Streptomyces sp. M10(2022)]